MARRTDSRTRMLQSGALLYRERGISATAFSDVLEHSGAPRGSVYHHFPGGKEQFAEEVTDLAGRFIADGLGASSGDLHADTDAHLDLWVEVLRASDYRAGCPVAAAALEGASTPGARDAAGRAFERWSTVLQEQIVAAGLPADAAGRLALVVLSAIEGAIVIARAQRRPDALEAVRTHLHGMIDLELDRAGSDGGGPAPGAADRGRDAAVPGGSDPKG